MAYVTVEDDIEGRDKVALFVLIVPALAHRVGELPGIAALSLGVSYPFLLRLLDVFMQANVDERLLVKVCLIDIADKFL
jgi:hypothetical protein